MGRKVQVNLHAQIGTASSVNKIVNKNNSMIFLIILIFLFPCTVTVDNITSTEYMNIMYVHEIKIYIYM